MLPVEKLGAADGRKRHTAYGRLLAGIENDVRRKGLCLRHEKERGPVEGVNGTKQTGVRGTVTSCKIRQSRRSSLRYLIKILCQ